MPASVSALRARAGLAARLLAIALLGGGLTGLTGAVLMPAPLAHAASPQAPAAQLEPLEIATAGGVVVLEVEVARTEEQRATGLMYRKSLDQRHGMLFDFKEDQPVYMWMKNTLIPLDMLFIRSDGSIARIASMTTPLSTEVVPSGEPVRAVLEIAGGAARKLGIVPGDKVAHPSLSGR